MNNNSKKPLSKEELITRLKAIASDKTPRKEHRGAMCYSMSFPPERHFKCDTCGCDICFCDDSSHERILRVVKEMNILGYDAKVEAVCYACAEKVKKELYPTMKLNGEKGFDGDKDIFIQNLNYIFYFRFPNDAEYHRAIANGTGQYTALLTLMENKRMYIDGFGRSSYIADEIDTLEFMTGIKFDF